MAKGNSGGTSRGVGGNAGTMTGPQRITRRNPSEANNLNIRFIPHKWSTKREITILVDPKKLDVAWRKGEPQQYLPRKTKGATEVQGRRQQFRNFLGRAKRPRVQASRVFLDKLGYVRFSDGRHRFAVMRNRKASFVAITVPKKDAKYFRSKFGVK